MVFEVATPKKYFREGKWGRVDFVISSKEEAKVFTEGVKLVKGEVMVVENRNNEPLRLQQIKAYGRPVYLCVYLEQGQAVKIHLDANLTQLPLYDLVYFKNDIPKALQVLYPADFTAVPQQKENLPLRGERWYESKLLMWAVIVIVGLFLVWMCIRIAHDVQKKA